MDGFNLAYVINPSSFEDMVEFLVPGLKRRGILFSALDKESYMVREAYIGSTTLPEDHPGSRYKWRAGEKIPMYQEEEKKAELNDMVAT